MNTPQDALAAIYAQFTFRGELIACEQGKFLDLLEESGRCRCGNAVGCLPCCAMQHWRDRGKDHLIEEPSDA